MNKPLPSSSHHVAGGLAIPYEDGMPVRGIGGRPGLVVSSVCAGGNSCAGSSLVVDVILVDVTGHIDKHVAHMAVGNFIKDLLRLALAFDQPRASEQAQMVADQRLRQVEAFGNVADSPRSRQAEEENLQPCRVAKQSEDFGENGDVLLGRCYSAAQCACSRSAW